MASFGWIASLSLSLGFSSQWSHQVHARKQILHPHAFPLWLLQPGVYTCPSLWWANPPILLCNSVQVSPLGNHSLNSLGSAECPPLDLDRALTPLSQPEVSSLPIRSALKDMFFKDIHPSIHLSIHPLIHPSTKYLMGVYYILGTQNSKPKSLLSESLFICVSPAPGRTIKLRTIATTSKNSGCSLNLLWYSFHEVCKSNHYAVDLKFNTLLYVNYSSIILVGKIVI